MLDRISVNLFELGDLTNVQIDPKIMFLSLSLLEILLLPVF